MNMRDWAKREVELACKRERGESGNNEGFDYGCACYKSALKAFESLMEDGHSGYSIMVTKDILNRLIDGKPLTPIEGNDDDWIFIYEGLKNGKKLKSYRCKRMSSLFKDVFEDGSVVYSDIHRYVCVDLKSGSTYSSGLVARIVNEMFPIKMPYYPSSTPYKFYVRDILTDPKNGDFDTVGIFYVITPEGEKIHVNRYFKSSDTETGWEEIDAAEWSERVYIDTLRKEKLIAAQREEEKWNK